MNGRTPDPMTTASRATARDDADALGAQLDPE
jgi:hypothetical protein